MVRRTRSGVPPRNSVLTSPLARVVTVVVCAVGGALLVAWFAVKGQVAEDKMVAVYRTHGCVCAFSWVDDLRAAGFVVRVLEVPALDRVRAMLHTPPSLEGCHVARYLGYFVEGHVAAPAIAKLAAERPIGWGLATATSIHAGSSHDVDLEVEKRSEVMLVAADGTERSWTPPLSEAAEVAQ